MSSNQTAGSLPVASTSKAQLDALPVEVAETAQASLGEKSVLKGLFSSYMDSNPYFSAGFGLMALGLGAQVLRKSAVYGATLAQRRMLVSLEISSKDASYHWFLHWMGHRSALQQRHQRALQQGGEEAAKALALSGVKLKFWERMAAKIKSHELAVETKYEERKDGSSTAEFALVPGPGIHYFNFNGAWIQVRRERATNMLDLNSGTPWETVTLTTLSRDRQLFPLLLSEARQLAQAAQVGKTVIYTAWGAEWRPFGRPRMRRLLDSVVLDQGVKERIVNDITAFMKRGRWYLERGIPYRRGYLLHGPPGSGKSSFIQALAGSLEYNICVLNLSERGLTDDKLNHLLANAPERTIILLEDVDAAFAGRQVSNDPSFSGSVTFSGLLNALDGVASSSSQRILFMTTNHLERLDPALIRPGRVDLKELIDDATPFQAGRLFRKFYGGPEGLQGDKLDEAESQLIAKVEQAMKEGQRISMASLQGHFIRHTADAALAGFKQLLLETRQDREARERVVFASSSSI